MTIYLIMVHSVNLDDPEYGADRVVVGAHKNFNKARETIKNLGESQESCYKDPIEVRYEDGMKIIKYRDAGFCGGDTFEDSWYIVETDLID